MKVFSVIVLVILALLGIGNHYKDYESVIDLGLIDTLENIEARHSVLMEGLAGFDRELVGYTNVIGIDFINATPDMVFSKSKDIVVNGVYYMDAREVVLV